MLSIGLGGYFSDNFLKYSTFYTSVSLESPFTPKQKFAVNTQEGTFEETTEEIEGVLLQMNNSIIDKIDLDSQENMCDLLEKLVWSMDCIREK